MADHSQPPSLKTFVRVIWEDFGSRMSGSLSVPFTTLGIFLSPLYAKAAFGALAVFAWLGTVYQVGAKERRRALELHGRPEVTIAALLNGGYQW